MPSLRVNGRFTAFAERESQFGLWYLCICAQTILCSCIEDLAF